MPTMNYDADSYDDIATALESRISFLRDNPAAPHSGSVIQRVKLLESLVNDLRANGRGYEGWSNWETWNVRLLIMNDETRYNKAVTIGGLAYPAISTNNVIAIERQLSDLRANFLHVWRGCIEYGRESWGDEYKPNLCNWLELLESFSRAWKENDDYTREAAISKAV